MVTDGSINNYENQPIEKKESLSPLPFEENEDSLF
jgi:hypothetical protein